MKTNVGSFDGAVRFVAGCGLLAMANHDLGWWGWVGLLPVLSSLTGVCLVYALLNISTARCDRSGEVLVTGRFRRIGPAQTRHRRSSRAIALQRKNDGSAAASLSDRTDDVFRRRALRPPRPFDRWNRDDA